MIITQQHESSFTAALGKPLQFSGDWEVALTQLIFTPKFTEIHHNYCTVLVKNNSDNVVKNFDIDPYYFTCLESTTALIAHFNNSVPDDLKEKISLKLDGEKISLNVDDVKVQLPKYLSHTLGFDENVWLPLLSYTNQTALFKPDLSGHMGLYHVLTDITSPILYGSTEIQLLCSFVLPQNSQSAS